MAYSGQRFHGLTAIACAATLLLASVLPAQASGDQNPGSTSAGRPPVSADFFFGRPRATVGVRGNWVFASASGDIFDFITDELTLDRSAFNKPALGVDLAVNVAPRIDVVASFEGSRISRDSEYRDLVDNNLLPIAQTTSLGEAGFTAGLKFALLPPGRRVSRYAWIPAKVTPYVGGGGGMLHYNFRQVGDFVDYVDNSIFSSTFSSSGWAPSIYAAGGTDVHVYRHLFLTLEGRYTWSSAELDRDFVDFAPMDLKGFRFGAGFHYAF